jgi:hypothetical protein
MVKLRQRVSVVELVAIAKNRAARISYTPSGVAGIGTLYAGAAVPWKMIRKAAGESLSDILRRISAVNSRVADGLTSAIRISVDAKGAGMALVQMTGGGQKVMPLKAANQSIGRPTTVGGRPVDRVAYVIAQAPTFSGIAAQAAQYAPGAVAA